MVEQLKNNKVANKANDEADANSYNDESLEFEGVFSFSTFFSKMLNVMPDYLRARFIPALVMIPIAVAILYSSKILFSVFILAMGVLMAFEWGTIAKIESNDSKWRFLGLAYIVVPCASLLYVRNIEKGSDVILWLLLVVWATDIGGLIVGKSFGGPKLAPSISPNKTWSGLLGGVSVSMLVGLVTSLMFKESAVFFILLSGFLAVIEQIGDLMESKFKRNFGVKDSGNIIPGHGGIMDRVDGLTLTAPIVALMLMFSNSIF